MERECRAAVQAGGDARGERLRGVDLSVRVRLRMFGLDDADDHYGPIAGDSFGEGVLPVRRSLCLTCSRASPEARRCRP